MTDKKELTEIEKLRRRNQAAAYAAIVLLVVGLIVFMAGIMTSGFWQDVKDPKHLTDPNIPFSELKNATWTWTRQDLNDKMVQNVWLAVAGGIILAVGWCGLFFIPEKKRLHKISCTGDSEWKYCPECGLELKELKEKGT
jgi:hypothetical protein